MDERELSKTISSTTAEQSMAHRGVISLMLALLVQKKVINRQVIERRLQALIDQGPAAGMTKGVLDEIDLVRFLMRAMLDSDNTSH